MKNGLAMSITTMPIDRLRPARSCRRRLVGHPAQLARLPVTTRSRVGSLTRSGELTTLDTVPSETPASAATSFMLTEVLLAAIRLPFTGSLSEIVAAWYPTTACPQPLTEPAAMPSTILRLKKMNMISGGMVTSRMAANSRLYWVLNWLWKLATVSWMVAFSVPGRK